jgi:hypothetical protein
MSLLPDAVVNEFTSPSRQQAEAAQRDFIASTLRYESGANIPQNEFDLQKSIYFPAPGDSPQVIGMKASFANALDGPARRGRPRRAGATDSTAEACRQYRGLSRAGLLTDLQASAVAYGAGENNENRSPEAQSSAGDFRWSAGNMWPVAASPRCSPLQSHRPAESWPRSMISACVRRSASASAASPGTSKRRSRACRLSAMQSTARGSVRATSSRPGLFNDALGDIGKKLPDGMGPGHAPTPSRRTPSTGL